MHSADHVQVSEYPASGVRCEVLSCNVLATILVSVRDDQAQELEHSGLCELHAAAATSHWMTRLLGYDD